MFVGQWAQVLPRTSLSKLSPAILVQWLPTDDGILPTRISKSVAHTFGGVILYFSWPGDRPGLVGMEVISRLAFHVIISDVSAGSIDIW